MLHMGVSASRDQKRASYPLEMELQEIMPHMKHVFWDWNSGSFSEQQDSYSLSCFHSSPNRPYFWTLHIWICNIVFCLWLFLFPNHVRRHVFIFLGICWVRPSLISFLRNGLTIPCPHFTLKNTAIGDLLLLHGEEGKWELRNKGAEPHLHNIF